MAPKKPQRKIGMMSVMRLNNAIGRTKYVIPEIVTRIVPRVPSVRRMHLSKLPTLPTIPEMPDLLTTSIKHLSSYVPWVIPKDPPLNLQAENAPKRRRIEDILAVEDASILGVHQLKEILTENSIFNEGCIDKAELIKRFKALQEAIKSNRQRLELSIPEDNICKVCMNGVVDCVLLECGHMASCSQCANVLKDCPVCGQLIVRAISTSRS